jgi:hypothetical protein
MCTSFAPPRVTALCHGCRGIASPHRFGAFWSRRSVMSRRAERFFAATRKAVREKTRAIPRDVEPPKRRMQVTVVGVPADRVEAFGPLLRTARGFGQAGCGEGRVLRRSPNRARSEPRGTCQRLLRRPDRNKSICAKVHEQRLSPGGGGGKSLPHVGSSSLRSSRRRLWVGQHCAKGGSSAGGRVAVVR